MGATAHGTAGRGRWNRSFIAALIIRLPPLATVRNTAPPGRPIRKRMTMARTNKGAITRFEPANVAAFMTASRAGEARLWR